MWKWQGKDQRAVKVYDENGNIIAGSKTIDY